MFNKKYSAHTLAYTTSGTLNRLKTSRTVKRRMKKKRKKERKQKRSFGSKRIIKIKIVLNILLRVDLSETF